MEKREKSINLHLRVGCSYLKRKDLRNRLLLQWTTEMVMGLACYCLLILVIACMTLCRGGRGKDQS